MLTCRGLLPGAAIWLGAMLIVWPVGLTGMLVPLTMTRGLRERRGVKIFAPSKETLPVVEFALLWVAPRVGHPSVPVRAARPSQLSGVRPTRGKETLPLNSKVGGSND